MLSDEFLKDQKDEFYKFYIDKMIYTKDKTNAAHIKLGEWYRMGKLKAVITQNIDGLHQKAGSKTVYELHGSVYRNRCIRCGKKFGLDEMLKQKPSVPRCECGGIIKPDVVLYGEELPSRTVAKAIEAIANADMLIVGGTSLAVYPAAGFIEYYNGDPDNLIVINKTVIYGFKNQLNGTLGELL